MPKKAVSFDAPNDGEKKDTGDAESENEDDDMNNEEDEMNNDGWETASDDEDGNGMMLIIFHGF